MRETKREGGSLGKKQTKREEELQVVQKVEKNKGKKECWARPQEKGVSRSIKRKQTNKKRV